jgi:hypothetical protein
MNKRLGTPVPLFVCPTRRACQAWPVAPAFPYMLTPRPTGQVDFVARSDYAINAGGTLPMNYPGPSSYAAGDLATYIWPDLRGPGDPRFALSGISHIRTGVRLKAIEDGLSNTYLAGEKYVPPEHYETGEALGDNESLYSGFCSDNHRFTARDDPPLTPARDGSLLYDPRNNFRFGSPHVAGASFVFCDGSVRPMAYEIDAAVHFSNGHTSDGGHAMP